MLEFALILAGSFTLAAIFTPIVRLVAIKFGVVDKPDPRRKLHGRIVARAGGTAVLLAVLILCGLASLKYDLASLTQSNWTPFIALMVGMIGMWALGLADDIWTLRGRQKLIGQVVLAGLLVSCGYEITAIEIAGWQIPLGLAAIPFSMMWLLGTTNALNLIDGADGLCSTMGTIICASLGILAAGNGHFAEAAIAFSMAGALLGFLVFNFPPAKIFLGDSGSLLIGFVAGALSIRCALKGPTAVAFLAPIAIMALPLFDSAMAIVRRKLTGRSIYTTDRAHLHHTLRNKGLGDRSLLAVVAVLASITGGSAILGQMLGLDWLGGVGVLIVVCLLIATKAFGHSEMVLVARRGKHFAKSLLETAQKTEESTHHKAVHLQGSRQWQTVWMTLVEFAERESLCKLHLDLNVPWLEEGFHGTWHRNRQPDRLERWHSSLPIHAADKIAGRIDVCGASAKGVTLSTISKLVELLEDLTPQVEQLLGADTPEETPVSVPVVQEEPVPVYDEAVGVG